MRSVKSGMKIYTESRRTNLTWIYSGKCNSYLPHFTNTQRSEEGENLWHKIHLVKVYNSVRFHSDHYEEYYLPACSAVYYGSSSFRRRVLPPSSWSKSRPKK
jgi:hypothetical protein